MTSARPLRPRQLDDPPDLALGDDPDPLAGRSVEQPEPGGAETDLAGSTPRRVAYRT